MNSTDLERYRAVLLELQQELIQRENSSRESTDTVQLDQSSVGRLSRMGAMQSQAMAQEGKRRREIQKVRISAALERIEEGEFGYCASCGDDINLRRLEVDPANPFCVECASKM